MKLEFSRQIFYKNTHTWNITKIRPAGAELFRADRWTDGRIDMTKLVAPFRNYANAPDYVDTGRWFCVSVRCVFNIRTPNQSCCSGSRFTVLLTADAEPITASACSLSGSMGNVLCFGNSYHVVSRVVTSVSAQCAAMNVGAHLSLPCRRKQQVTRKQATRRRIPEHTNLHSDDHGSLSVSGVIECRTWSAVRGSVNESRYSLVIGSQLPAFSNWGDNLCLEIMLAWLILNFENSVT
jgi:hypothetical protein